MMVVATVASPSVGCIVIDPVCEPPTDVVPEPQTEPAATPTMRVAAEVLPVEHRAIDLLFVVDNSGSMRDEQEQLGIWSSELFNVLSLDGELPDLHIAVTSSSIRAPLVRGCENALDGRFHIGDAKIDEDVTGLGTRDTPSWRQRFLRDVAGPEGRERNYEGSLTEAFAQMALVGDGGCGFEQPFEATRRALSGGLPENAGFLRDEALLVIVMVTDEDDCSTSSNAIYAQSGDRCSDLGGFSDYRCFEFGVECADGKTSRATGERRNCRSNESSEHISPVSEFASFVHGLKDHPGKVVVAGIYGKPNSVVVENDPRWGYEGLVRVAASCDTAKGGANPGVRVNEFLSMFPARAAQSSICEPDLSWAMRNTALLTRRVATQSPCLDGEITDPASCELEVIRGRGTADESAIAIPPCIGTGDDGVPCFAIELDAEACGDTPSSLAFRLDGDMTPGTDETLAVSCPAPSL